MEHSFIENELVILTKQTLDIFLKQENPSELIALYTFYYYTAKWQKTNQPKCTTEYVSKCLHWNRHKVIRVKKQLLDFGLIEDARIVDETTKKVTGYYIKMNYIFKKTTIEKNQCAQKPQTGFEAQQASVSKSDTVENEHTNALSTVNINALSTVISLSEKENEKQPKKENKKFTPPTIDEVKEYCHERNNHVDPEKFIAYYDSVGWFVGKKKMKSWKSAIHLWEKRNIPEHSESNKNTSYDISAYENYSIFDDM